MLWLIFVCDVFSVGLLYWDGLMESFFLFKKGLFLEGFVFIRIEIVVMR